ncbi:MAG: hypothetical protein KAH21_08660, partial [Spirochaetaceae bacterium]|nr:hypothetical protein [Spirochaetaceae bacterium]
MISPEEWRVETARSGDPTVLLNGKALHSRYNPVKEAEKTASSVPSGTAIVILGGFGLGYTAEALLQSAPERPLIIAEADNSILERASGIRDISSVLNNPMVTLITGEDLENISNYLTGGPAGSRIHLIIWRPSQESA